MLRRRHVATPDGIDRVDVGIGLQGCKDETTHSLVKTVAVVDLDQVSIGVSAPHCAAESHLPLFLAADEVSTQGDEDVARPITQPLPHEVISGRTGRAVVHADIGQPLAAGQVGYQGDNGDTGSNQPASKR
jgi:hypothetical protein